MLLNANKAINSIKSTLQSMMKVSAKYGEEMGAMGRTPFNSATGSTLSHNLAKHMGTNPGAAGEMLDSILRKAKSANMSPTHMERMNVLADRIRGHIPTEPLAGPNKLKWI